MLTLEERLAPERGSGQLLVDVAAAGVNYRDVHEREGRGGYGAELALVAGVEGAGTVRAVGLASSHRCGSTTCSTEGP